MIGKSVEFLKRSRVEGFESVRIIKSEQQAQKRL